MSKRRRIQNVRQTEDVRQSDLGSIDISSSQVSSLAFGSASRSNSTVTEVSDSSIQQFESLRDELQDMKKDIERQIRDVEARLEAAMEQKTAEILTAVNTLHERIANKETEQPAFDTARHSPLSVSRLLCVSCYIVN